MADRWVCLPGTLCSAEVFAPLLDALQVLDRETLMIDRSSVEEMIPLLRGTVQPGDIVCGFSLGAIVAAHAAPHLSNAKALVLLALNPGPDDPAKAASRIRFRDRVLRGDASGAINKGWKRMSIEQGGPSQRKAEQMATELAPLILPQTALVMSRGRAHDHLIKTAVPTVFATGSKDEVTPPNLVKELAAEAPKGRFEELGSLGHFALLEDPEKVATAVRRALRSLDVE